MRQFVFYNPTQIVFGEGKTSDIGRYLKGQKCLFLYGSTSIKQNGIYDKVIDSLKNHDVTFVEKSGVKPNPVLQFSSMKRLTSQGKSRLIAYWPWEAEA